MNLPPSLRLATLKSQQMRLHNINGTPGFNIVLNDAIRPQESQPSSIYKTPVPKSSKFAGARRLSLPEMDVSPDREKAFLSKPSPLIKR